MSGETGIRDLLTGLFTRDYFDEIIGRELERSRRQQLSTSVLSVVLTNYEGLLVVQGEEARDRAVIEAAKVLLAGVREKDSIFRWEEDEFLVVLLDADASAAALKVQQLAALFRPWRDGQGPLPFPLRLRIGSATHTRTIVFANVVMAARAAARQKTQV